MDEADFIVAVNTPSSKKPPHLVATDEEYDQRRPVLEPFVRAIQKWIERRKQVIAVDVAYPNGSDPAFVDLLREYVPLDRLAAYGGGTRQAILSELHWRRVLPVWSRVRTTDSPHPLPRPSFRGDWVSIQRAQPVAAMAADLSGVHKSCRRILTLL
jgi:hypothetical protein